MSESADQVDRVEEKRRRRRRRRRIKKERKREIPLLSQGRRERVRRKVVAVKLPLIEEEEKEDKPTERNN